MTVLSSPAEAIVPPRGDRPAGTRSRAGNAMARTEAAIVAGVGSCLAAYGLRRTTMIDIATAAGIARGTLYNHVRTKAEALGLYADYEVAVLAVMLVGDPAAALSAAAEAVAAHPVLRRLAVDEPAALAAVLAAPVDRRRPVDEALSDLLGADLAPLARRWLLSLVADPGEAAERASAAAVLSALARQDGDGPAETRPA